jgi:hypothetical protein
MKKTTTTSIFVILLVLTFLLNTSIKAVENENIIPVLENTPQLCTDGLDNDFNGLTDSSDPSCSSTQIVSQSILNVLSENTPQLCTDGLDNDFNGLTDSSDPSCNTPTVITPPTPTTSGPSFGGGSGPSFSSALGGGITSGTPVSAITSGIPVSATGTEPMCADMFKTYMKKGKVNNVNEVKKLQKFLNIKTTGLFGNMTEKAVKAFQLKYKDSVLTPWKITDPTGYFYKTTQRQMNLLICSTAEIPMPVLK